MKQEITDQEAEDLTNESREEDRLTAQYEVRKLGDMLCATAFDDAPRLIAIARRVGEIAATQGGTIKDQSGNVHLEAASWQSIESAPQDGSVFLAFCPHHDGGFQFVATVTRAGRLVDMMSGDAYPQTTLWQPLPAFPENKKFGMNPALDKPPLNPNRPA